MRSNKIFAVVGMLVVLAMLLSACATPTPKVIEKVVTKEVEKVVTKEVTKEVIKEVVVTPTPVPGEEKVTLHVNLGTEPPTADPSLATDTTSVAVIEHLFLGLTDLDDQTYAPVPELATKWEVSEDGLEWTFYMRDDVTWVKYNPATGEVEQVLDEDGNPRIVNAHDVVYGVKRTCDPRTGSDYAYVLYIIKGCEELNTADPEAENFQELYDAVGVEAVDDFTVKFTLTTPAGFFPQIASMWVARPMPQWVIEEKGDRWIEPGFIVTNGPYTLKDWVHEDHIVLTKNPHWYGWEELKDQAGNIEEIYGVMITEASTAFAMYENNELDLAGVPLDQMDRVKSDPVLSKELVIQPIPCTYYYGFTTTKPPVDNPKVRKALSMAIDRKTLVEEVLKGGQIPANTFAPSMIFGSPAGDPDIAPWALPEDMGGWGYEKAVEEAKKLMADAGYPDGEGLDILLMHNVSEGHAKIAQAIQAMWQEAFPKAKFTIETQEWKVYLKTLQKETPVEDMPHVWRLGWCADYPDENNWVHEVFNPEEGANRPRLSFDDPYIGDLIKEFSETTIAAKAEQDVEKRKELYKKAEKLLVDDIVAIAPIYYYTRVGCVKPWLERRWHDTPHWETWKIDWEAKKAAIGG